MLNVFLGYGCNLKCSYCLQAPMAQRSAKGKPDASQFIEKVVPWAIEKNIRKIAYWGGEPLLYWNIITEIHEAFIAAGHKFDMIKIATNGTLWTQEHVDKANEWDAYIILSQHLDFGTPKWDEVMKLRNSSLSFLYHKGELEPWGWIKQCEELEQKYGGEVFPYMHWSRATPGADPSTDLTFVDLNNHMPHLWELARMAVDGHRHAYNMWIPHLLEWRSRLDPSKEVVPMCYGDHQIDVDLKGDRYVCHHTVEPEYKSGTIHIENLLSPAIKQARRFVDTDVCKSCEINTWCRGQCHLSRTHDVDCRLSKYKHRILSWLDTRMPEHEQKVFTHD